MMDAYDAPGDDAGSVITGLPPEALRFMENQER
jgi:hypothetical protein